MSAIIDINQQDVNILKIGFKCIWSIFLNNSDDTNKTKWVEMPLYFETQDKTITQPTYPYHKGHFSDLFFNIHNFQQLANMLNLAIFKASLLLETPLSGVLPKFEIEPTSHRVIFTYNPSTFITKTKCQIAFNGPLHTLLNGFNCGRINIFSTDELSIRRTIQIPTQYNNFFFSNVLHNNGVFFIEGGAPAVNFTRFNSEKAKGSSVRTFLLVDQNAGTIESSTNNPEFMNAIYNNMNVSTNIVGILDNQIHRLYYNSILYDPNNSESNFVFGNTQHIGTSSNNLVKTYDGSKPYLPLTTNNDIGGFPNIVFYRSPDAVITNVQPSLSLPRVGDATVIMSVAGDYAAGLSIRLNSKIYPIFWNLKNNIVNILGRNSRIATKLYNSVDEASIGFNSRVLGTVVSLIPGKQWFLGCEIKNGISNFQGVIWEYTEATNTYIKTNIGFNNTNIQFFGMSQNETFIIAGQNTGVSNASTVEGRIIQTCEPAIYNRLTGLQVPIIYNTPGIYSTETDNLSRFEMPVNAKFINNLLYLTSNITFNTDVYFYNPDDMQFQLIVDDVTTIPNFNLKDSFENDSTISFYGVDNKAKTPDGSISVANELVLYVEKITFRQPISSNIYPILSSYPPPTGETKIIQFNTSIQVGNNINTINFSSNLLPISKSSIANPVIFNDQVPGQPFKEEVPQNSSNNSISNIVTDFTQYLENGTEDRDMLLYNPSGEYRLINLLNNQPVRDIDLTVTYTDNFGATFPLLLRPQCSATIKLMFRKKDFYSRN
jgi:hypothetical protein